MQYRLFIRSSMVIILAVIILGLSACGNSTPTVNSITPLDQGNALQNITVSEAFDLVQKNLGNANFRILDVRTPDEYQSGHLANALNIDIYAQDFESRLRQLDKNQQYLVYCRTGVRSTQASQTMSSLGFTRVFNMLQGITQWIVAGYPTTQ